MIEDITEKKRAQEALREQAALLQSSEELLRIFVNNAPAGVAMFDRDMRYLQVSDRWCADYSVQSSQILGRSHYELFPDAPHKWKEMHRRGLAGETLRCDEDRWDRADGTKWVRWEIRPWWNLDGAPGGILIFAEDISQRRQMQEALSDVTRKLVEAQEKERARIARELHDDISQRLGLVSMGVDQLLAKPSEIEHRALELRRQIDEISADVHTLAADLHPQKLEYLGAVAGLRSWIREFAQRHNLELAFSADSCSSLRPEIGVTFFRVLQEALQNTVKHSAGKRVEVQLREDSKALYLVIRDSGKGFDVGAALLGKGLGLTSMRERVRLVNGTINFDSKSNGGTAIEVRVPLEAATWPNGHS
jgi:PAS domain S-box-containing protein